MTVTHTEEGLRDFGRTVLVVGATGAFGERLAEGLIRSGIGVIGAARNTARLDALARRLGPRFAVEPLDRSNIDAACLQELRGRWPGLFAVADASGPFQTSDYALPRAAIGAGLHYVDLADARAFVRNSRALDEEARAANVAVLAGASSTPALSHAVLDTLVAGARMVIAIEVSIAPGNRAPRGLSTSAGGPLHGRPTDPGVSRLSLGRGSWMGTEQDNRTSRRWNRRVALCETPDLDLLVERYHPAADAIFRAGLELRVLHEGVAALGLLVRLGILKSLAVLARPLRASCRTVQAFRHGSRRHARRCPARKRRGPIVAPGVDAGGGRRRRALCANAARARGAENARRRHARNGGVQAPAPASFHTTPSPRNSATTISRRRPRRYPRPPRFSGGCWATPMMRCRLSSGRRTRCTVFSSSKARQTLQVPTTSSAL